MKPTIAKTVIAIAAGSLFASCAPTLAGKWTVQKYETIKPGQQSISLSNIGTMTFKRNGNGEKNLDYVVLGMSKKDDVSFKWVAADKLVTLEGEGSDLSKTWIVLENKKKYQKWQSTNGGNEVQTLELKK